MGRVHPLQHKVVPQNMVEVLVPVLTQLIFIFQVGVLYTVVPVEVVEEVPTPQIHYMDRDPVVLVVRI
jgi:hypothetical protein